MEKKSILIVDDDQAILQTLNAILGLRSYTTNTAETYVCEKGGLIFFRKRK